jgi:hypothetical protein
MKGPGLQIDERTVATTRKICTRLYLLTIAALWIDVCWRQFIAGQPLAEFADLAALMTANVILFVGAVLYYGGVAIPKIRPWAVAALYLICIAVGMALTYRTYHSSSAGEIFWKLMLVAAIAGVVVLLYVLAAYWGAKKADKEMEE